MFFSSSFFVKRLGGLEYCQATEISSFDVVVVFLWVDHVFSRTEGKRATIFRRAERDITRERQNPSKRIESNE
jgi:hypothetical protein